MKIDMIIAAGGSSVRFNKRNKLLYKINKKTIIEYTLNNIIKYENIDNIILVYNYKYKDEFEQIIHKNNFNNIKLIKGGNTRTGSVLNGLNESNGDIVFVHDGARPFIKSYMLDSMLNLLKTNSIVIPCIKPNDTIRLQEDNSIKLINRENVCIVQTPQCTYREFLIESILKAKKNNMEFTDEAEYIVYNGGEIIIIEGNRYNIKFTNESDIKIFKCLLKENNI